MESPKVAVKRSESQMRFFDMCVDHYLNKNDWHEFDTALISKKEVEVEKELEEYRNRRGQSPTKRLIGKFQFYAYLYFSYENCLALSPPCLPRAGSLVPQPAIFRLKATATAVFPEVYGLSSPILPGVPEGRRGAVL